MGKKDYFRAVVCEIQTTFIGQSAGRIFCLKVAFSEEPFPGQRFSPWKNLLTLLALTLHCECVSVGVCVCERERERETDRQKERDPLQTVK